jgi:hypothetical protein
VCAVSCDKAAPDAAPGPRGGHGGHGKSWWSWEIMGDGCREAAVLLLSQRSARLPQPFAIRTACACASQSRPRWEQKAPGSRRGRPIDKAPALIGRSFPRTEGHSCPRKLFVQERLGKRRSHHSQPITCRPEPAGQPAQDSRVDIDRSPYRTYMAPSCRNPRWPTQQ